MNRKLVKLLDANEKENFCNYTAKFSKEDSSDTQSEENNMTDEELTRHYQGLILKLNKLKDEKKKLDESEAKKKFIKTLHEYNELKDTCQVVLGKIAELQNRTITELHDEYGLNPED
jgi:DNA replication protein DnaD